MLNLVHRKEGTKFGTGCSESTGVIIGCLQTFGHVVYIDIKE